MEDATFRLNMVYTLAAGTAQRPFATAPVAVCNRRMQPAGNSFHDLFTILHAYAGAVNCAARKMGFLF